MKKYKLFNKGASEKDFAEYPLGKWSGNTLETSPSHFSSDIQADPKRKAESFNSASQRPIQNSTSNLDPQAASNGHHYDHYNITHGELSDQFTKNDSSSNLSWHHDQPQKTNDSTPLPDLPEKLKQKVADYSKTSVNCDTNDSWQPNTTAESSTVMTVALGEIGSISKYVSQGNISISDIHTSPTESSSIPVASLEGEEEANIEMQPELTITSAFSLSAEMWETGKPNEEMVESEKKNPEECSGEDISFCEQTPEEKDVAAEPEPIKMKKETKEEAPTFTPSGTITPDPASPQKPSSAHATKKAKVYLHQCSVPDCHYSTNVIREFISHYSVNHDKLTSYMCRWCKSTMNSLSVFVDHVRENFVVPWVKCPHCYLKKKNKSEVVEHIAAEHPGESQRVIAGSMFLCRSSSHSREKDSKIVSESHKTLVSLLSNQKYIVNSLSLSGNDNLVGIVDPSKKRYQCSDCSFNTTNVQVFLAHVKVCDSMKSATKQRNVNFECKECSFATSSREAFLNHCHVKASLMNGMKRAPYKKRSVEVRNKLIRKKVLNIKKQTLTLKLKKDKEVTDKETKLATERESVGNFKFSCPYCSEKFHKLNRMKFHIFLSHHDNYSETFPLHQCLSCHMKSSSEEIVRQHIERTHFGRKSGILLINEPPEIIPRKCKPPDTNKRLVQSIAPIIKIDPSGSATDSPKKSAERCSSWGRNQNGGEDSKLVIKEVICQETKPQITETSNSSTSAVNKETEEVNSKIKDNPIQEAKAELPSNDKKEEEANSIPNTPPKHLAMEIVKFTAGDHFTEYIECPQCSYQSRSVMGFYGHIKRHDDLLVQINTRRKYESHKKKAVQVGLKTEDENTAEGASVNEVPLTVKSDEESSKENPETPDEADHHETLSPMSPIDQEIKCTETTPLSSPPKLESIIINKKSENLIDKDEYSKLGGPILDAKLSSMYTSKEQVKVCKMCGYMSYFLCYIHRHLLSAHLNIHFWECGYCFYRHLQRHKVVKHCSRNHTNREPYAKWLGIPDWEKKLAACMGKTKPVDSNLPDHNNPTDEITPVAPVDSFASSDDSPPSPSTPAIKTSPEPNKSDPNKIVRIEKLPGNLFKCSSCAISSINLAQVMRHISYQHNAQGHLLGSELESGTPTAAVSEPKKPLTPPEMPKPSARTPVSAPSTLAPSPAAPATKKSSADQAKAKKSAESKTKPKKKITSFTVPKTPYRCVFCNYVNMSATEVKKHMWREHSDELNNVGILLKSKEESEKSSVKTKHDTSNTQKVAPIKRKLKRTYRPHKRKKTKTYTKRVKEPGKKKQLANPSDPGSTNTTTAKKWTKKSLNKDLVNREAPTSNVVVEEKSCKRPAMDMESISPVMPKKRQIQSTQHSDYEWESPSLAEPPNSKSERIYKSAEETSYRISSSFEKFSPEKEAILKSKTESLSDVPSSQENYQTGQNENPDIKTMPVFRKAEMDIYKRFIFKTYDGIFLCNYCLVTMSDEIEARQHILRVHPKKPTNPLEQPCKTFQLFRKKTRRPEIIVPHAAQPRVKQKLQNGSPQKKGSAKNKTTPSPKLENIANRTKKDNQTSLFEMLEDLGNKNHGGIYRLSGSGWFDENAEQALLQSEGDVSCMFTWKWADQDDKNKTPLQHCTDSEQVSVLKLITYRQGKNVTGHFKCPFCQLTSTSHIRVSDHIRLDHMELERHKCQQCSFKSWFQSLLENHRRLQHVAGIDEFLSSTKEEAREFTVETAIEPEVQAPLARELFENINGKKDRPFGEIHIMSDYRTLYLRKYCPKNQAVMYVCQICLLMFTNQNSFFEHVTSHYGEVYQCTGCTFRANPREKMEVHIEVDHTSPKPNLIVLHHEPLIKVTNYPHPEQTHNPIADPPLISEPSPNTRPRATKFPANLTLCCLECPTKVNDLETFESHVMSHWHNNPRIFSSQTNFGISANSSYSYSEDSHRFGGRYHGITGFTKNTVNFAAYIKLSDIFSYYSDNVFSFYS